MPDTVMHPTLDGPPGAERVLILAPLGRDSAVAAELLRDAGLEGEPCGSLDQLVAALGIGAGCAVITQEAVQTADLHPIFAWLRDQPSWSDLPLIIITERGGGPERNPGALRLMDALGNVTFLERPFRPSTLLSVVQSALRSRRRQYQARARMAELLDREKALQDSEARHRTLAENIPVLAWTADADGWVFWYNSRWFDYTGTTPEQMEGWGWQSVHDPAVLPAVLLRWRAALDSGEPLEMVYPLRGADGIYRPFLTHVAPVREAGRVVRWFGTNVDISAERRAEAAIRASEEKLRVLNETLEQQVAERTAQLRQNEEALRQAQKMEAIGQLTGGIAHDFNNMLQGIGSGIEMMDRRIKAGRAAEAGRYVEAALQSVDRAAALTHRLLAFSRRQALAPRRVELDDLVNGMAGLIRQTVGPAITVRVELTERCWPVRCDPNQLENALLNLAINARDAMGPGGGDLLVSTAHVVLGPHHLHGWAEAEPGDHVRLSVTDTGCGMPPAVLAHAFEPFFTTKPAGQGTGLGLSQVFGFISQSKGLVQIESEVGRGTAVHLCLPRLREAGEAVAIPSSAPRMTGCCHGSTVLLVEDEPDIRDLAAEALRDLGCQVISATNGSDGLSVLRDLSGSEGRGVDVLVADIGLPGELNGRQLADAAHELAPALPVLLITGYAGEALGPGVQVTQRMELLSKPFALNVLAARVEAMLSAGKAWTPRGG